MSSPSSWLKIDDDDDDNDDDDDDDEQMMRNTSKRPQKQLTPITPQ